MSTEGMRFMKVGEVADILNISKSLAYEYMQGGDCPFTVLKINSRYVVPYNSFCAWYESLGDNGGERRHK
ncbi:MAG: helix-turn-helix domain-containing protein [Lachnospiraceae bacterium]|nr:helix-turn-helix domain-containing protein [Lachnospiraceae bacterium]